MLRAPSQEPGVGQSVHFHVRFPAATQTAPFPSGHLEAHQAAVLLALGPACGVTIRLGSFLPVQRREPAQA